MLFSGKGFPWNSRLLSDGISTKITRLAEWTRKLNLPRESVERPASFLVSTSKSQKKNFKVDIFSIPLANSYYNNEWTPLIYIGQMVKNLLRLTCKFYFDKSERKSTQLHASTGQTDSQVDASWKLWSTCDCVWPSKASVHVLEFANCDPRLERSL